MANPLTDRCTPSEFAVVGQVIEVTDKISDFERLARIVAADLRVLDPDKLPADWGDRMVSGRLSFGFTDARCVTPTLTGRVAVTIDAVCQRCLEAFRLPLSAELKYLFPPDSSATIDAGDYEIWELDGEVLRPLDLVDEALIIALPLSAMHADTACNARAAEADERLRPFANLRAQMNKEN